MNILEQIVSKKRAQHSEFIQLAKHISKRTRPSFKFIEKLKDESTVSVIAEIKRGSPSKGLFAPNLDVLKQCQTYHTGGASAISILTDSHFYGNLKDLETLCKSAKLPVLAKDFIVYPEQIEIAHALGADIILLIAATLDRQDIELLLGKAKSLKMDVIVELHDPSEIHKIQGLEVPILGINSRNLKTFEVSLKHTLDFYEKTKAFQCPVIAESGIFTVEDAKTLAKAGFDGMLIGESLIRSSNTENLLNSIASIPKGGLYGD